MQSKILLIHSDYRVRAGFPGVFFRAPRRVSISHADVVDQHVRVERDKEERKHGGYDGHDHHGYPAASDLADDTAQTCGKTCGSAVHSAVQNAVFGPNMRQNMRRHRSFRRTKCRSKYQHPLTSSRPALSALCPGRS